MAVFYKYEYTRIMKNIPPWPLWHPLCRCASISWTEILSSGNKVKQKYRQQDNCSMGHLDNGTTEQQDNGTMGKHNNGTTGWWDIRQRGQRDNESTGQWVNGTMSQRDNGTTGLRDNSSMRHRTTGQKDSIHLIKTNLIIKSSNAILLDSYLAGASSDRIAVFSFHSLQCYSVETVDLNH